MSVFLQNYSFEKCRSNIKNWNTMNRTGMKWLNIYYIHKHIRYAYTLIQSRTLTTTLLFYADVFMAFSILSVEVYFPIPIFTLNTRSEPHIVCYVCDVCACIFSSICTWWRNYVKANENWIPSSTGDTSEHKRWTYIYLNREWNIQNFRHFSVMGLVSYQTL